MQESEERTLKKVNIKDDRDLRNFDWQVNSFKTKTSFVIGVLEKPKFDTYDYLEAWSKKPFVSYVKGVLQKDSDSVWITYYVQFSATLTLNTLKSPESL